MSKLVAKATETLDVLRDQGLITAEHELTAELIVELCESWEGSTPNTKTAISREIRHALASLPRPEQEPVTDPEDDKASKVDDLLNEFSKH
ncbi:hypothetical protein [Zhihengliuella halotolerans]|uniref:Uncharacterized protein n=1 Tax=Zhihengliuella halotolerans TaxID=370736 RepID=A0A4Q8ACI7_9MICC|nr:hypothetical protein [Zhihengliuella halotolerans]RZU61441.1 hypothetical protein EV380_1011 [Zhihengliuella halotolerans]